jgi:GTP cyclohydrolase IIa
MSLSSKHNIFLIGIGGIGMSALAKYFIEKNKNVFGYDREKSMITIDLTKMGAKVDYNVMIKNNDKITLNCGIGNAQTSRDAVKLATKSLDTIREIRDSGKQKPDVYEL